MRIYTEAELMAEKPKGELLLRNDKGVLWKLFSCHGCQSCWRYVEESGGEDRVEQAYPHFISFGRVEE